MTDQIIPLYLIGVAFAVIGLGIGFYYAFRDNDSIKTSRIVMFVTITILGVIFIVIGGYEDSVQMITQEQERENKISANIENMTCTQLHDALLHNTINGTDHIQRASERYIASCESK